VAESRNIFPSALLFLPDNAHYTDIQFCNMSVYLNIKGLRLFCSLQCIGLVTNLFESESIFKPLYIKLETPKFIWAVMKKIPSPEKFSPKKFEEQFLPEKDEEQEWRGGSLRICFGCLDTICFFVTLILGHYLFFFLTLLLGHQLFLLASQSDAHTIAPHRDPIQPIPNPYPIPLIAPKQERPIK